MNKLASSASLPSLAPRPSRLTLMSTGVAFVAAVLIYATTHLRAADAPPAPAPKVTVAPVEERLVTEFEELTGHVDATETVELRARVSGHLDAVNFQAGQLVEKGQLLFTIDPRWYKAQFDLATAQVAQARAHAETADREAKRTDELLTAAAISSEEAESRRSRALEARAALASAEAALVSAKLDLDYTEVRAPIAGRVSRALVTPGNLVSGTAGNATQLTTIVSTGDAYVYADLDESALLRFNRLLRDNRLALENGHIPVEMALADDNGYPHRGYIESSDNRLNPATGSLVLRMVFANADQSLVPGLFARVRVPISAPQHALLISDAAIGTDQNQKFVLALGANNAVVYRTVQLGSAIDDKRIVTNGLKAGDRIVVNGLQRVRPGMIVAPELAKDETPVNPPAKSVTVATR